MLALGAVGLLSILILLEPKFLAAVGPLWWNNINSYALTAVPLFIFMGELLMRTGVAERLYNGLRPWFSRLPGGSAPHKHHSKYNFFRHLRLQSSRSRDDWQNRTSRDGKTRLSG